MSSKLIKDAVADSKTVSAAIQHRAKGMFLKEFAPQVKAMLHEVINEEVSTGSDQPGGYSPEEDQDAIQSGSNINKNAGDGLVQTDDQKDGFVGATDVKESSIDGMDNDEFDLTQPEDEKDDFGGVTDEEEEEEDSLGGPPDQDIPVDVDDLDQGAGMDEIGTEPEAEEEDEFGEDPLKKDDVIEVVTDEEEEEEDSLGGPPDQDDEDPFAKKESKKIREAYRKNLKIAKKLYRENQILKEAVNQLRKRFEKVDLFNAQLAYAFKTMHQPGITRNEKKQIAETFDKAKSKREVILIYNTMKKTLGTRAPIQQKKSLVRSIISESTNVENSSNNNRLAELSGLL